MRRIVNVGWLVVVLVATFSGTVPMAHPVLAAIASAIAAAGWLVIAFRLQRPPWLVPVAIVVVAAGGVAALAAVGTWSTPLGFCFFAVLSAGVRLPMLPAVGLYVGMAVALVFVLHAEWAPGDALVVLALGVMLSIGMVRRENERRAEEREMAQVSAARVLEEQARSAALAERARIARDVHDVLAHSLSALAVQLQGARLMLHRDGAPADTIAQVERAQHLATEGLAEARRAVAALRTEPVDLAKGLQALVAAAPGATLEIVGDGPALDAAARETVLRTAQESLTNARKHAEGQPVRVRLTHLDDATELVVHNAGPTDEPRTGGYGLIGMAERAALAGGTVEAGAVEDGWQVRLVLPATPVP